MLVALTVVISIILLGLIPQAVGSAGALPQHASAGRAALASADWSSYLDGPSHDSYNGAAKSISTSNIANLQPVWRALIKDPTNNTNTFRASPTVVDGIVYIGSERGYFYALNEATQTVLWTQNLGDVPGTTCGTGTSGIISTAAVVTDPVSGKLTVYVNAPNGYLYAMDAATGTVLWKGLVGIPSTTVNDYYAYSSPLVSAGVVYIGISSECDQPLVPAGLLAFNQSTGAQIAFWHSLPTQPPGTIGASIWSSPAALSNGSIIATTGNNVPGTQYLYADSIVHLAPSTLKLKSGWQIPVAQQINDADFGASPTVFKAVVNGVSTPMVGACNKNGNYYAFAQSNLAAGPIWQYQMGVGYGTGTAGGQCDAGAIFDGKQLIEGGGSDTTINGVSYEGSVQALNPATGVPIWQTGLPGEVIGSPTEDGGGVVAAPVWASTTGYDGVYLLNGHTGAIIGFISTPGSGLFGQAVFDGNELLVGASGHSGLTSYQIATPGPAVTQIAPNTLAQNAPTTTVTVTGSGFSGTPQVFFPGTTISVSSVTVVSPTTLTARVSVGASPLGPTPIVVTDPGPVADTCANCLTITP